MHRKVDRIVTLLREFLTREQSNPRIQALPREQIVLKVTKRTAQAVDHHEHRKRVAPVCEDDADRVGGAEQ